MFDSAWCLIMVLIQFSLIITKKRLDEKDPEHSLFPTLPTSTSENISFLPYSPTPLTVDVTFHISDEHISQKVKGVLMWNLRHIIFYMKTKILADFQICISVPLRAIIFKGYNQVFITWYVFVFANYFL